MGTVVSGGMVRMAWDFRRFSDGRADTETWTAGNPADGRIGDASYSDLCCGIYSFAQIDMGLPERAKEERPGKLCPERSEKIYGDISVVCIAAYRLLCPWDFGGILCKSICAGTVAVKGKLLYNDWKAAFGREYLTGGSGRKKEVLQLGEVKNETI